MAANRERQNNNRKSGKRPEPLTLDKISAPYRFVPLQGDVYYPQWWQDLCDQQHGGHSQTQERGQEDFPFELIDMPFEDGLSGKLELDIQSHSPLLPGVLEGKDKKGRGKVAPFQLPDNEYAIPGSTLRGMIRSVLEIASASKMKYIDDKRLALRDLTAGARPIYGDKLTRTRSARVYEPRSLAGWLYFDDSAGSSGWKILPCEYGRVEHHLLNTLIAEPLKHCKTAEKKYQSWLKKNTSLVVQVSVTEPQEHQHSRGNKLYYRKVTKLVAGGEGGTVVFTGQPGPNKHMEFVFLPASEEALAVPDAAMRGFMDIHRESNEWKYLNKLQPEQGLPGIPVFYLTDDSGISSLGLAMMYKLAYATTGAELVRNVQKKKPLRTPGHLAFDLVELLFGCVDDEHGKNSFKGRVSFSVANCTSRREQVTVSEEPVTILNSPKATYYPNYIKQAAADGAVGTTGRYNTLMKPDAEISGWKRYPVHDHPAVQKLSGKQVDSTKVQVQLKPITSKPEFSARLRFHNLKPEELGALVWALEWGGDAALRHSIGMGKPFGFGQVSIRINREKSQIIANDMSATSSDTAKVLQDALLAYQDAMLSHDADWHNTVAVLKAMANPAIGNQLHEQGLLRYLNLGDGPATNEFLGAKRGMAFLTNPVIPDAAAAASQSQIPDSEAGQWCLDNIDSIAEKDRIPDMKKPGIWFGRGLAGRWQEIEDSALKQEVKQIIKAHWEHTDSWEPGTGARKKAFNIYTADDEA